jgi:hypothetical protein
LKVAARTSYPLGIVALSARFVEFIRWRIALDAGNMDTPEACRIFRAVRIGERDSRANPDAGSLSMSQLPNGTVRIMYDFVTCPDASWIRKPLPTLEPELVSSIMARTIQPTLETER